MIRYLIQKALAPVYLPARLGLAVSFGAAFGVSLWVYWLTSIGIADPAGSFPEWCLATPFVVFGLTVLNKVKYDRNSTADDVQVVEPSTDLVPITGDLND